MSCDSLLRTSNPSEIENTNSCIILNFQKFTNAKLWNFLFDFRGLFSTYFIFYSCILYEQSGYFNYWVSTNLKLLSSRYLKNVGRRKKDLMNTLYICVMFGDICLNVDLLWCSFMYTSWKFGMLLGLWGALCLLAHARNTYSNVFLSWKLLPNPRVES